MKMCFCVSTLVCVFTVTDNRYNWEELEQDVPNPNYIALQEVIPKYVDTVRELYRSLTTHYSHGQEYKESWFRTLFRFVGLLIPGLSAHCPTDYINPIRPGKQKRMNNVYYKKLHVNFLIMFCFSS